MGDSMDGLAASATRLDGSLHIHLFAGWRRPSGITRRSNRSIMLLWLGGIFGGGKGAGIGSIIGGAGGLGTTAFHGHQKITLSSGQEMLIRITGR